MIYVTDQSYLALLSDELDKRIIEGKVTDQSYLALLSDNLVIIEDGIEKEKNF